MDYLLEQLLKIALQSKFQLLLLLGELHFLVDQFCDQLFYVEGQILKLSDFVGFPLADLSPQDEVVAGQNDLEEAVIIK